MNSGAARRPDLRVLVVNAGSSSLKLRLLDPADELLAAVDLPADAVEADGNPLGASLAELSDVGAVGHRIVHGGERYRAAVPIDPGVESALRDLADLAPLHQSRSLAALKAVGEALPDVPAIACFDTAFHATLPPAAATYALPAAWRRRWALRRYGFHGLSHDYVARRAAEMLGRDDLRLVTCHLGAGASLAAINAGVCVDTTMGFTPLEGLVMATRSGSVDPGLLLWLLEHGEMRAPELREALEYRSGIYALAGTADMAEVVAGARAGEEAARLAFDVYVHRLRAGIAAMAAAIGGLDGLVFTGGLGENAPAVRAAAAEGLGFLGVEVDQKRNETASGDEDVSAARAAVRTLVVASREDLEIARHVRAILDGSTDR